MKYKVYSIQVLLASISYLSRAQEIHNAAHCSYELKICKDTLSKRITLLRQTNCPYYDTISNYHGDSVVYIDDGDYFKVVDKSMFYDLGSLALVCTNTKTNQNVKLKRAMLFCKVKGDNSRRLTLHNESFTDYGAFYVDNKQVLYHIIISDIIFEENNKLYRLNMKVDYELR